MLSAGFKIEKKAECSNFRPITPISGKKTGEIVENNENQTCSTENDAKATYIAGAFQTSAVLCPRGVGESIIKSKVDKCVENFIANLSPKIAKNLTPQKLNELRECVSRDACEYFLGQIEKS